MHGQSAPWRSSEQRAANSLRTTLLEVVLKMSDERNAMRKQAQDRQEILIAELNHRVRNILNLIQGLVSQGKKTAYTIDEYRSVLDARIFALARAHDQLTQTEWDWVSLRGLVDTEVEAYLTDKATRVVLDGDDIDLSPNAFTTLALVVHELATNSAKYGALKTAAGSVAMTITLQEDGSANVTWREKNGPPVQPPTRRGFGTTIIERSIPFELKGTAEIRYRVTGFEADFMIPAPHLRKSQSRPVARQRAEQVAIADLHIRGDCLVLEDNMVIGLDASDMLSDLGADHVHISGSVSDALDFIAANTVTFALLDMNLGNETSLPVIEKCQELGIPVLLATGYGAQNDLPQEAAKVAVLKKPYNADSLRSAMAQVLERHEPTRKG